VATVFMKWLERNPQKYDRGIRLLTLGRLSRCWDQITTDFIRSGMNGLELGCGTGGLTCRMAKAGAVVTAIDISPRMLSIASDTAREAGILEKIHFKRMDATRIADHFPARSFDLIVASLMMSELSVAERTVVLESCAGLIKPDGRLVLVDEVIPEGFLNRLKYNLFRVPLAFITWILTRTSTQPLREAQAFFEKHAYIVEKTTSYLGGSLCLFSLSPSPPSALAAFPPHFEQLRHRITLKTLLIDLWALFFRIIPPYPKVRPDLYVIGDPSPDSPVLVTGNFDLTIRRVVKALDGKLSAWLLVVDSAGINVWCASGGGFLTSDKIISAMHTSRLEEVVRHRRLVLPQLCAAGVDGNEIREETDWNVVWGPVRATDIPEYVRNGFHKSDDMRSIRFPILDRLEMVSGTLGFYGLLLLIPLAIFWRSILPPFAIAVVTLSYFYALVMPWLPGRDGLAKSVPLAAIAIVGVIAYSVLWDPASIGEMFNRGLGVTAISVFVAGELQGMSPLMRGEQANWIPELFIAGILGLIYWLLPMFLGWR
jgi:ubiquinone/menaquinone biosynthesis C-methylase UbiE